MDGFIVVTRKTRSRNCESPLSGPPVLRSRVHNKPMADSTLSNNKKPRFSKPMVGVNQKFNNLKPNTPVNQFNNLKPNTPVNQKFNNLKPNTPVNQKFNNLKPNTPVNQFNNLKPKNSFFELKPLQKPSIKLVEVKIAPKKKKKRVLFEDYIASITVCKNYRNCNDENCKFIHNPKTKMCKFEFRCKNIDNCCFAHHVNELYVPECRFGNRCHKENCTFKHPVKQITVVESVKKVSSSSENLAIIDFPQLPESIAKVEDNSNSTVDTKDDTTNIIDYTKMKCKKTISDGNINGTIETCLIEYESIEKFNNLTFNIE